MFYVFFIIFFNSMNLPVELNFFCFRHCLSTCFSCAMWILSPLSKILILIILLCCAHAISFMALVQSKKFPIAPKTGSAITISFDWINVTINDIWLSLAHKNF